MNKRNLFPFFLLASVIIAVIFVSQDHSVPTLTKAAETASLSQAEAAKQAKSSVRPDTSSNPPAPQSVETVGGDRSKSSTAAKPIPLYEKLGAQSLNFYDSLGNDPRFLARNDEELLWLKRNGYPHYELIQNVRLIPESELLKHAQAGDAAYQALLGYRYYLERKEEAQHWLDEAIINGSLYAMQLKGETLMHSLVKSGEGKSFASQLAMPEFMLAAWYGDYRALNRMGEYTPDSLSDTSFRISFRVFMRRAQMINDERARRGLPPLSPDLRPNEDEWREDAPGPPPLTVYAW